MRTAFFTFFIFLFSISHAFSAEVGIFPLCVAQGPVYLFVTPKRISGFIGTQYVKLERNGSMGMLASGTLSNHDLILTLQGQTAIGTLADKPIKWRVSPEGDVVYGFESCLIDEE